MPEETPIHKLVIKLPPGMEANGPRASDSLKDIIKLRQQLAAIDTSFSERYQSTITQMIERLSASGSFFQQFADEQRRRQELISSIAKPMSEIMAERIAEFTPAPGILRAFETRLDLNRMVLDAVKNVGPIHSTFFESALRGYTALQQVSDVAPAETPDEAAALITEQEVCLAGAVAVVATEADATTVQVRIVHVVERVDEVLSRKLGALGLGLEDRWQGARDALTTRNPDRAGIVSFCVRELTKGTINALVASHAAEFSAWIAQQQGGQNNLAWKARFILRNSRLAPAFAETDAMYVVALLDHLNTEGVHRSGASVHTDAELRAILHRVEGWLASLLEIGRV